jgi:tetratricopeptide (TPR) repeat protein
MNTRLIDRLLLVAPLALLLALSGQVAADTVYRGAREVPYNGKIEGINERGLTMIWDQGNTERVVALSVITRLNVTGQADFNAAEDLMVAEKPDYKKALQNYERAKLRATEKWLKDYINSRMVVCFDKTGQLARAVKTYIELCQSDAQLAALVKLPAPLPKGNPDNQAAMKAVEGVLATTPNLPNADQLKQLRISIRLIEADPAEILAEIESQLPSASPELQQELRLKHIDLLLQTGKIEEARKSLVIARQGQGDKFKPLDAEAGPMLYFLEGRLQYEEKDYLHAALTFMRLPIGYSRAKPALAAEGLYWAGKAMSQVKDVPPNEVKSPLKEAVEKFPDTDGAAKAKKLLDELESQKKS